MRSLYLSFLTILLLLHPIPSSALNDSENSTQNQKPASSSCATTDPNNPLEACYFSSGMSQRVTSASGASVLLSQEKPKVGKNDYHSLAELIVGTSDRKSMIEIGWRVSPRAYGDIQPRLFVFHWVNGLGTCYDACGFISTSKKFKPGQIVTVGKDVEYKIVYKNDKWIVSYDQVEIGYFPAKIWNNTFSSASMIKAFGEVASASKKPSSEMGNGSYGTNKASAKITNFQILKGSEKSQFNYFKSTYGISQYSIGAINYYCTNNCSMRYGGPGF